MIIFINGSINSGKSAVAKILAEKLGRAALLEIDSLRGFIEWMPIEQAVPINLENAVAVIKVFAAQGLDIIVPYPLSKNNHDYFLDNLKGVDSDIKFFTLNPRLEIALTDRGARKLDAAEKERIRYHYSIGINNPDFGQVIDNSDETPEQTAEKILGILKI